MQVKIPKFISSLNCNICVSEKEKLCYKLAEVVYDGNCIEEQIVPTTDESHYLDLEYKVSGKYHQGINTLSSAGRQCSPRLITHH